jgi:2',3'-cyclic-nucleotide 2'-phosphodiesterase (5'-nucleotidase family)
MKCLLSSLLGLACVAVASAEDVLTSKRALNKRFIDEQGNYNISFFHINDVHAHLDEFRSTGTDCASPSEGCFGGYARVQSVIKAKRPGLQDSLFLNVGDEFQVGLFIYA